MLGLWYTRIIGTLACTMYDILSFIKPLTHWTFAASPAYYGVPPPPGREGAQIGELPAGRSRFSFGAFTKVISRKRFR